MPRTDEPRADEWSESFPQWFRVGHAVVPLLLAVAIAIQRDALVPPRLPALVALLATLPWLLELLRLLGLRIPSRNRARAHLIDAAVVLGAVLILVVTPQPVDVAPFFLVYLAATASIDAPRWAAMTSTAASIALLVMLDLLGEFNDVFVWVLGILAAWGGGAIAARQHRLIEELHAANTQLAARAAADERRRIAREIHDVIAHSLAVTMLHLTGARMALRRDPDDAEAALLLAEQLGRRSMAEIRRTVGLLGDDPTGDRAVAPLPGAAEIEPLVREFAAAGLDVDLECTGDLAALEPGTGLGLYRIAQESLANVGKHAPEARARVQLCIGTERVRLRVWNEIRDRLSDANPDGRGVEGMCERAIALGGSLTAGPCTDGWCVEADLPQKLASA